MYSYVSNILYSYCIKHTVQFLVTAKKFVEKKFPEKSPLAKKSFYFKVSGNKVLPILELFFWLQYEIIQKFPRDKSSIIVENAWERRMFTTMQKRGNLY